MDKINLTLPMPPSVNNAFPTNRQGRRFPSPKYKEWKELCTTYRNGTYNFNYEGEIVIATYTFYSLWINKGNGLPKIKDLSNYFKCLEDYFSNIIKGFDDRYIWGYENVKKVHSEREEVEIELKFIK